MDRALPSGGRGGRFESCISRIFSVSVIQMNKQNTNQPKLILASGSAYRKQALESLNLEFETIVSEADESFAPPHAANVNVAANAKTANILLCFIDFLSVQK